MELNLEKKLKKDSSNMINPEDISKLKQVQLEMFKTIIKICNKYNICYFCFGGTALGAVRHSGFIPWDDDIDVAMKRKDYERFIKIAPKELPPYYFLQNYKTDPDFRLPFAKIRDSRTTFIETSARNLKINHGVYIDLFILDGFPDKKKQAKNLYRLNKLTRGYCAKDDVSTRSKKANFLIFLSKFYFMFRNTSKVIEHFENKCKKNDFDNCERGICFGSIYGLKDMWPTSWFNGISKFLFEGIEVNLPKDYDKYLKQIYGDYMQLPPESKRIAHHYCDVIDFEKPYTYYINKKEAQS